MLKPLTDDDPRTIGPYRLQNRIGAGGMGTVYLGFGPTGESAAIKVPTAGLAHDSEFRARFRQEVAAAQRVHGRRVATVLDADVDADRPWMATEYVEGASLSDAVHAHGSLEPAMLTGLATGLAEALAAVHSAGVIHRDLKPSNILLSWEGPKVIDFGIARAMDATRHTRTGMIVGTMVWMAPEQLRGERAGMPADVFAWGACIAFAGTGRPPFHAERPEAAAIKIIQDEPDLDGLPEQLEPLVYDALAKDPAARPTAAELVSRLAAAAGTTAVTARLAGGPAILPEPRTTTEPRTSAGFGRTGAGTRDTYRTTERGWQPQPPRAEPPADVRGRAPGRSRVPVLLAAAVLALLLVAAVAAAIVTSGNPDPASDDGTAPPSPTATSDPVQQAPPPQPVPQDTGGGLTPADTTSPQPGGSPTDTASPTGSPTGSPTTSRSPSQTRSPTTPPPVTTTPPAPVTTPPAQASPTTAPVTP